MEIFYLYIEGAEGADGTDKNDKRNKEYKTGRYLVEYAARNFFNIKNSELEIINNKPKFKYSDICFSISHSKNIVAVCFDKNPVGFDIEYMKQRNYRPIIERMNFKIKEDTLEEFYKEWTRYEAKYKLQQECRNIMSIKFEEEYIMSIASSITKNIELDFQCILN